jgi:hypothetical protein
MTEISNTVWLAPLFPNRQTERVIDREEDLLLRHRATSRWYALAKRATRQERQVKNPRVASAVHDCFASIEAPASVRQHRFV